MAWAEHTRHLPAAFTKEQHKLFEPSQAEIDVYLDILVEEAV